MTALSPYDQVHYPGYTHPQTHPNRLAVMGRLFGMAPGSVTACRVLELGCGNGSNLLPMAAGLPGSNFLGVDLAEQPIAEARREAERLGIRNVIFQTGDVRQFQEPPGSFDYIIAHGLYSWIPEAARDAVLEICHRHLAPQGIAYISYNALPGSHLRMMLSEMMRFHIRGFSEPREQIGQARALAALLAKAHEPRDIYSAWMGKELERMNAQTDEHLFHDDLAECNQPFYFREFMEQASRHGLQYLGEADYFEMSSRQFDASVRQLLDQLGPNRILREQYLDFLKCRRFRQTLLCRRACEVSVVTEGARLNSLYIASPLRPLQTDGEATGPEAWIFETPRGARCETDYPAGKAALKSLSSRYPQGQGFTELCRDLQLGDDAERLKLANFLLSLYEGNVVELRAWDPPVVAEAGERPVVPAWIRGQASRGDCVCSMLHHPVRVEDEIGRSLLCWMDGSQNRHDLHERLWQFLLEKGAVKGDATEARQELAQALEKNLSKLARMGLLTA